MIAGLSAGFGLRRRDGANCYLCKRPFGKTICRRLWRRLLSNADVSAITDLYPAAREEVTSVISEIKNPAVAILPFSNLSGEADQDYFANGVTEDITTALSKNRWAFYSYRALAHLVSALGHLGDSVAAQSALDDLIKRKPEFSCDFVAEHMFYIKDPEQMALYLDGLRRAGVG